MPTARRRAQAPRERVPWTWKFLLAAESTECVASCDGQTRVAKHAHKVRIPGAAAPALMQGMKTLLAVLGAAAALSGCVIAPIDPGPGPVVYAAPPPVIVRRPYSARPRYGYWRRGYWR